MPVLSIIEVFDINTLHARLGRCFMNYEVEILNADLLKQSRQLLVLIQRAYPYFSRYSEDNCPHFFNYLTPNALN